LKSRFDWTLLNLDGLRWIVYLADAPNRPREYAVPFNFEKFTDIDTTFAARITVRQTGQFGFNAGAINRFRIGEFGYCVLYMDMSQRVVGLELTDEPCDGALEIKKSDSNTYVRAKNFCDRYGIDYRDSHRFELKKDDDSGLLYFELGRELAKDIAGE
jgi:hypothetical protein